MLSLRTKLLAGLASLMAILIAVTLVSNSIISHYGKSIQNLFHDDYESATACQAMKESVENLTHLAEARIWNNVSVDTTQTASDINEFNRQLAIQSNIADVP